MMIQRQVDVVTREWPEWVRWMSSCCGFVVVDLFYNKSTTNRSNGIWTIVSVIIVAVLGDYTPCLKNSQNCFRQNFVKFPLTLIIFGTKMAKTIELY